jgi:hypothetical protein
MLSEAGPTDASDFSPKACHRAVSSSRKEDYAAKMRTRNKPTDNKHGPFIYGWIFHSKAYRSLKTKHAHLIYNILRSLLKDKQLKKAERKAKANAMS